MDCEKCGKRPATVHITRIVNNQKTEEHLCEECAREQQPFGFNLAVEPGFSLPQLFASLLSQESGGEVPSLPAVSAAQCPQCHLSYNRFTQEGKFGCRHCYEEFSSRLESLFRKIHGNARHNGKVPRRGGKTLSLKRQLEELRQELKRAVRREEFERAAQLRDKIRELEEKISS